MPALRKKVPAGETADRNGSGCAASRRFQRDVSESLKKCRRRGSTLLIVRDQADSSVFWKKRHVAGAAADRKSADDQAHWRELLALESRIVNGR
jgi:hypothetical protein